MKIILIIIGVILLLLIAPLVWMWIWQWIVPDVFSGAVENNVLPAALTYLQAVKLMIFCAVILGINRGSIK